MSKLKFGRGNAKLDKAIYTFSLPAGKTCPGADICHSQAVQKKDGRREIKDGPACQFRCFAATQEVMYTKTFEARQHNLRELVRYKHSVAKMATVIMDSLPRNSKIIRIHVSGDFWSQNYFDAWCCVASTNPQITFYAYTKSLHFWTKRLGAIPKNLRLVASKGGKMDHLIGQYKLKYAQVVYSEEEAQALGLPIDHDDSHAIKGGGSFALLLHGVQPKGSKAATALKQLRKRGKGGYSAR